MKDNRGPGPLPKSTDGPPGRLCDFAGMHSRTLESLALIAEAVAVDLVTYSCDGDPLAVVEPVTARNTNSRSSVPAAT